MSNKINNEISRGIKWSAIEKLSSQVLQFVIMILLARLLGPKALGLIGMITVFISISQIFIDGGFYSALIRKESISENDLSTTFTFNLAIAVLCYFLIFSIAPAIAEFYNEKELVWLLRFLGLTIIFSSFSLVQRALLTREMDFKKQSQSSIMSSVISGGVALFLAYRGFGVMSLVVQNLLASFLNSLFLNIISKWRIKIGFDIISFNSLFGFGSKLLISSLIDTLYNNAFQIIIGKIYSIVQLGYYSQARLLSNVPAISITLIIQRVSYPTLSKLNIKNEGGIEKTHTEFLRKTAMLIFPLYMSLAINSEYIIRLLLGDEWLNSAILLSILALGYMMYPINALNLNIINVKGRSDIFLKLELIKKAIFTLLILSSYSYGVVVMCLCFTLMSYIEFFINLYYVGKVSEYTCIRAVKTISPTFLLSAAISIALFLLASIFNGEYLRLFVYSILMLFVYPVMVFFLDRSFFYSMKNKVLKTV
ncbi:lipopolysaccharide biosynthesis protein [Edwardsiella tarda]|uniref:lipopolysaccharide biosynthesis protein n=1 Tax=Edwardsiella TaxID=635 RepID=UPI00351CB084